MNVLIADDFPLFRRGVKEMLSEGIGAVKYGEAASAPELLEQVRKRTWDVLVMDISMPGTTGTEALKRVKAECPSLPVIVLSMHPEDQYAVRMVRAGAAAYLNKASAPQELVSAVRKVVDGGQYVSPTVAERLARASVTVPADRAHEQLSDREYEVLRLIASGQTVSEVAELLGLSVTTVSTYRARILDKMHMKNNAELTRYALQHRLVE
ncbi:DNA-binding response regulator [Nitrospira sp.]|nr:DNA-binding response regulator [Nitrospira sp.]